VRPVELVHARLEQLSLRVVGHAPQWTAQCPAHDDRNPSLRISDRDGVVGLKCLAGCTTDDVLVALDLTARDLFPASTRDLLLLPLPPSSSGARTRAGGQFPINTRDSGSEWVRETAVLRRLLDDYRVGPLCPVDVPLDIGRIPRQATTLRAVAEWIRVLMGLCLAEGEWDPLPFSTSFCCELMGWDRVLDKTRASKAIHKLERLRVIRCVGSLPPLYERRNGTRLFQPYGFLLEDVIDLAGALFGSSEFAIEDRVDPSQPSRAAVERYPMAVEVATQPAGEVDEQPGVDRAVPGVSDEFGVVAASGTAHSATDGNTASGGINNTSRGAS
jgi:hypothetical protein